MSFRTPPNSPNRAPSACRWPLWSWILPLVFWLARKWDKKAKITYSQMGYIVVFTSDGAYLIILSTLIVHKLLTRYLSSQERLIKGFEKFCFKAIPKSNQTANAYCFWTCQEKINFERWRENSGDKFSQQKYKKVFFCLSKINNSKSNLHFGEFMLGQRIYGDLEKS